MARSNNNHNTNRLGRETLCAAIQKHLSLTATLGQKPAPFAHVIVRGDGTRSARVEVHATNYKSWQFTTVEPYLVIAMDPSTQTQRIVGLTDLEYPDTPVTFVSLGAKHDRPDRFFVFSRRILQQLIKQQHERWLAKHGGTRPKNPDSTHCAIPLSDVEKYENDWSVIREALVSTAAFH